MDPSAEPAPDTTRGTSSRRPAKLPIRGAADARHALREEGGPVQSRGPAHRQAARPLRVLTPGSVHRAEDLVPQVALSALPASEKEDLAALPALLAGPLRRGDDVIGHRRRS